MKVKVALNGTDSNPYEVLGLTQNPIPQTGKYEWDAACLRLQKLGGPPIPKENPEKYIRETLAGFCSEELISLCLSKYLPGLYTTFTITFPD